MKQTYIVEVDEITGKTEAWFTVPHSHFDHPEYHKHAPVAKAEIYALLSPHNAKALSIGQKVLEAMGDDLYVVGVDPANEVHDGHGDKMHYAVVRLMPKEPAPLTGLAWLKSLPVGTVVQEYDTTKNGRFSIGKEGLHWAWGGFWHWDGRSRYRAEDTLTSRPWWHKTHPELSERACPGNCSTWGPEDA